MAVGVVLKEVGKRIFFLWMANAVFTAGAKIVENNKAHGRTWYGRKKSKQKNTYVDWYGNVILGTNDCRVD